MRSTIMIFLLILANVQLTKAQSRTDSVQPLVIGQTRMMHSAVLNENRTLNVYLPYTYDSTKAYPVIYLLDGSINEDFLHIVGLVQFFTMQMGVPEFIVVGIANVDRKRDFTFHTDIEDLKKSYPTTGRSDRFISFVETELQPFIDATYKTTHTRFIIGQSLGGLAATEILLKNPKLFTHYLIVSPSLWWDDGSLLKNTKALLDRQTDMHPYVYVSVGAKEDPVMIKDAKELADILQKAKKPTMKVEYLALPNENHATVLHQSITEAFKKLFPYKDP